MCPWCLQYTDTTVTQMSEAWEDILLEMDSKLKKLAEDKYVSSCQCLHGDILCLSFCYVRAPLYVIVSCMNILWLE